MLLLNAFIQWVNWKQVSNVDDVLSVHQDLQDSYLKECMLTDPDLLGSITGICAICTEFCNFMQVNFSVVRFLLRVIQLAACTDLQPTISSFKLQILFCLNLLRCFTLHRIIYFRILINILDSVSKVYAVAPSRTQSHTSRVLWVRDGAAACIFGNTEFLGLMFFLSLQWFRA